MNQQDELTIMRLYMNQLKNIGLETGKLDPTIFGGLIEQSYDKMVEIAPEKKQEIQKMSFAFDQKFQSFDFAPRRGKRDKHVICNKDCGYDIYYNSVLAGFTLAFGAMVMASMVDWAATAVWVQNPSTPETVLLKIATYIKSSYESLTSEYIDLEFVKTMLTNAAIKLRAVIEEMINIYLDYSALSTRIKRYETKGLAKSISHEMEVLNLPENAKFLTSENLEKVPPMLKTTASKGAEVVTQILSRLNANLIQNLANDLRSLKGVQLCCV